MSATVTRQQLRALAKNAGPGSPLHALLRSTKRAKKAPAEVPPSLGRMLTIIVPMPANFANTSGSRQFMSVYKRRNRYWESLDVLQKAGRIPEPPSPSIGVAAVTSTMYLGARMDRDNSVSRHKWLLDWLEDRGYVHNDRLLDWPAFPVQIVKRGQDYRIELLLTEPEP